MSDVSESLRSLTKNERMSESLIFLSELLIRSFLDKKRAIRSETKWANSQPCQHLRSRFHKHTFAIHVLVQDHQRPDDPVQLPLYDQHLHLRPVQRHGRVGVGVIDVIMRWCVAILELD